MEHKHTNRLIHETSPYLLQHAHNPVDWYPWGDEAFQKAKSENRPILFSIGYSACHWCHVMERESFENEKIAALMNDLFINIKVDREERPDLDEIYMNAVQMLTGRGGWPMTVFLTPEGKPFYGGTYFPPEDRYGSSGVSRPDSGVANAYREKPQDVESSVEQILAALHRMSRSAESQRPFSPAIIAESAEQLLRAMTPTTADSVRRQSFPMPACTSFSYVITIARKRARFLEMVTHTLTKMAGGGFTITSAADFIAIPSTPNGWCLISRKCSTTTPSWCASTRTPIA